MPHNPFKKMPFAVATLVTAAIVVMAVYAAALTWLWFQQEKLLFAPTVLSPDFRLAKAPDVHEVYIDVPGARLSALHLRLPNPKGVIFFLHGNAGSLENWFVMPDFYRRANFDLFMIDYRGYGKSTGHIESEAQLHSDVRAAFVHMTPNYTGRKVVIYGRSLGSGLAAGLAAELAGQPTPDLTVLVSPYISLATLANEHFPWVPQAVLRYPMRTDQRIGQIHSPLILFHGARDTLIPAHHSDALKAVAPHATVLHIPEAAHNDVQNFDSYLEAFAQALDRL